MQINIYDQPKDFTNIIEVVQAVYGFFSTLLLIILAFIHFPFSFLRGREKI